MKRKFTFRNYVIASILFHVIFVFSMFLTSLLNTKSAIKEAPVEVALLTEEEMKALQQPLPEMKQIADSSANDTATDKAKYLSEKNNSVEKETKARVADQFKNSTKQASKKSSPEQKQVASKVKQSAPQLFNPTFDPYAALAKKELAMELKNLSKGQAATENGEASSTNDHLDGVTEDLITKLNTKEYKYYGFYHRIKLQLNQWWQPKVREKVTRMVRQGRTIASDTNKTTKLVIVLNDIGNLIKVQVLGESGVRDLDDAAVEAFRQAAPFPNPPKGIIESDGTVKIRWDFVIES
ncbi:MAG: TonB family protein [Pseudobdellovibrio sp.]